MRITISLMLSLLFCAIGFAQELKSVNGHVTHLGKPISNVNVIVKGTSKGSKTDENGQYSIVAEKKDVLLFSFVGMETVEISVNEILDNPDVELEVEIEELEEVVVKKRRSLTQRELMAEYPFNKNLIKTSRGIMDKDISSVSMRIIDAKDLISVGPDFLVTLKNHFPRMIINITRDSVFMNERKYIAKKRMIFDVDGFIHERPPTYLMVNEIDRIAVLTRNGAFARYGPSGVGGVVIINTKESNRIDELGVNRTYDNSDLVDSLLNQAIEPPSYTPNISPDLKEFAQAVSEKEAINAFQKHVELSNESSPYYYLELANHFKQRWANSKKSEEILDWAGIQFSNNVEFLKALAYIYEEHGQWDKALNLYLRIIKLKSKDAQSHRDLANSYSQLGNWKKALHVYTRYEMAVSDLDTIPFDKYGTDFLITTEVDNIIRLMSDEPPINKKEVLSELEGSNTRLVLEWNNDGAEFELQVVNPQNYFDNWNNAAIKEDSPQMTQKLKGYSSKQFFLDNGIKGEWKVNINYLGNDTKAPTYLKIAVYFNFGMPSQTRKIRVFKLTERNLKLRLMTIDNEQEVIFY